VRPTFGTGERLLEAHIFDFEGDLYGERLRVEFVRRLRGEKKFASVAALIDQMQRDATAARAILGPR
jgi:riboflavin kinase/FMN adenylyltransferase